MPKVMGGSSAAEQQKFQAESDVRTLIEAAEIRADKSRFQRAVKEAKSKLKALQEIENG